MFLFIYIICMSYKGRFTPKNPNKYNGDSTKIVYRSLWERRFMVFCDGNPSVLGWSSEEMFIPYVSPIDNKKHRYFVDFKIKTRNKRGFVETHLIEIKPKKQCKPPTKPKRMSKRYITEVQTWGINSAKWEAAKVYADLRGWKFQIITEDTLFAGKNNG